MPRKVFVSYSHRQGEWVWDRLVPVLKAGGEPPLIDRERFRLGHVDSAAWAPAVEDHSLHQVQLKGWS